MHLYALFDVLWAGFCALTVAFLAVMIIVFGFIGNTAQGVVCLNLYPTN